MKRLSEEYSNFIIIDKPTINKNEIYYGLLNFAKKHNSEIPQLYMYLSRYDNKDWDWELDDPEIRSEFDDMLNKVDTIAPEGTKFLPDKETGKWGFFPDNGEVTLESQMGIRDMLYILSETKRELNKNRK